MNILFKCPATLKKSGFFTTQIQRSQSLEFLDGATVEQWFGAFKRIQYILWLMVGPNSQNASPHLEQHKASNLGSNQVHQQYHLQESKMNLDGSLDGSLLPLLPCQHDISCA